jgi:hypothetical protein
MFIAFGCDPGGIGNTDVIIDQHKDLGTLDINFIYKIPGIPADRVRKVDLSLAYTADSLNHGQFFTSKNVSDAESLYRFYLPPGTYYYQATIICLCQSDSCLWSQFPGGQFGLRMDGGKVEVKKGLATVVSTQFH